MLLLTLVLIIWIETFYVFYLKIPEWSKEIPHQGWLAQMLCREAAIGGVALLWLFWALYLLALFLG